MKEAAKPEPRSVSSATRWSTAGQLGGQAMRFLVILALAKLIRPEDYQLLELALYVTGFVEVIKSVGTSEFLIKEKELPPRLLASVFWINVGAGFAIAAFLWLAARPIAAVLLHDVRAAPLVAWLGLTFAVLSFAHVHEALLRRAMMFDRLAVVLFLGPVAYGLGAIPAALAGLAAISFVVGGICEALTTAILLWCVCSWRPQGGFAWSEARKAFHFSFYLTGSETVRWITSMSDRLIVRRMLGDHALGVYGLGRRLLMQATKPLTLVFQRVVFSALADVQADEEAVRGRYVRACATVSLVGFPVLAGIGILASPLVALLGDEWRLAAPVIQIFAPAVALQTAASTVGVIYLIKSRTDWLFAWSVFSGAAIVAGYWIGAQWGTTVAVATVSALVILLLFWPAFAIPFRLLGLPLPRVLGALLPATWMSLVMAAIVWVVMRLCAALGPIPMLVAGAASGALVYVWLLRLVQPIGLDDLLEVIPDRLAALVRRRRVRGP